MDFSKNARVYTSFIYTLLMSCVMKSIKSISSKTKWHVRRFFNNRPSWTCQKSDISPVPNSATDLFLHWNSVSMLCAGTGPCSSLVRGTQPTTITRLHLDPYRDFWVWVVSLISPLPSYHGCSLWLLWRWPTSFTRCICFAFECITTGWINRLTGSNHWSLIHFFRLWRSLI